MTLPADVRDYPDAIAQALSQLRLVGVNGPYSVLLSADAYTGVSETSDHGYPVLEHIKRLVDGEIIWAPAIAGAFVLTTRGGDFDLHIGQDVSIGYLSHTDNAVRLYLQETFTFLLLTTEASVALHMPTTARPSPDVRRSPRLVAPTSVRQHVIRDGAGWRGPSGRSWPKFTELAERCRPELEFHA